MNDRPPSHSELQIRLANLRTELLKRDLDGFIVPHADQYLGEYVPTHSHRLGWITGFTGSAGLALVLAKTAILLVDGRYTLQVKDQIHADLFDLRHVIEQPVEDWLSENMPSSGKLGYDPWHFTEGRLIKLAKACEKADAELVPVETNPIDAIWEDQPPPPLTPVVPHPMKFSGEESADKRLRIGKTLAKNGVHSVVLTAPDSIAWLLNVRGGDVPNTPLPLSFAILHHTGQVDWFIDDAKVDGALIRHIGKNVQSHPPEEFGPSLDTLSGKTIQADAKSSAAWVFKRLEAAEATIIRDTDPCQLPKAIKNDVELAGARAAHIRDGTALTNFLAWLAAEAPNGGVDEVSAQEKLEDFRSYIEHHQGPSFDTISGAGAHSAVVHYRATRQINWPLEYGTLYLVDSGGQYLDGTTDVTRTVAIGPPTDEMRIRFTQVLKGHIAIAQAVVPVGSSGSQIDTLARIHLWRSGVDFDHGTGHGVGSYLGVHEGPQNISKRSFAPFKPGMIVSNEPGYYKPGDWGIRIENLVEVVVVETPKGGEKELLGFETLTLAPIDRSLVDTSMLTEDELRWLNDYHTRVADTLSLLVDTATQDWLMEATAPLG
jgi:Xaa-Pro aminopeptidase